MLAEIELKIDARMFSTDQIADYFDRQQPELMRREIDLICSHLERSVKKS